MQTLLSDLSLEGLPAICRKAHAMQIRLLTVFIFSNAYKKGLSK
jgi:hypothetical protein